MSPEFPILEHDDEREAVIEPSRVVKPLPVPRRCVLCFFDDVIARWERSGALRLVTELKSAMGRHPVYEWSHEAGTITLVHPGLGGPLVAIVLEELIALGCQAFVACGGAGVLEKKVQAGQLIVPSAAVRDEGTSYHYLPPGREVSVSDVARRAIERALASANVPFRSGKTWTTDAVYRETPAKVAARRAEGCVCVEMEGAALFAVAGFRRVPLGQLLYAGDDVSQPEWDRREEFDRTGVRERLVGLAAEACAAIPLEAD